MPHGGGGVRKANQGTHPGRRVNGATQAEPGHDDRRAIRPGNRAAQHLETDTIPRRIRKARTGKYQQSGNGTCISRCHATADDERQYKGFYRVPSGRFATAVPNRPGSQNADVHSTIGTPGTHGESEKTTTPHPLRPWDGQAEGVTNWERVASYGWGGFDPCGHTPEEFKICGNIEIIIPSICKVCDAYADALANYERTIDAGV